MSGWRHVRAVLLLPVVVTLVVPALLVRWTGGARVGWDLDGALAAVPVVLGLGPIACGLALVVWTVGLFVREGKGRWLRGIRPRDSSSAGRTDTCGIR